MCSIIGYLGENSAAPVIVKGLKRMEYRGYDSVGVATFSGNQILVRKGVGKVAEVNNTVKLDALSGTVGIGHTRWATHGGVTEANAHPHPSSSGEVAIVHNGIIENYLELKKELQQKGYTFKSETDSEIIANLLQYNFDQTKDIKKSMMQTVSKLRGNYAFVAVFENGILTAARFHEPLIIGVGKDGYFISSDVLGFVEHTDEVIYPDNREFVIINSEGIQMFNYEGNPVQHQITKVSKELADAYKGDYAHFTLKEISEQPLTILKAGDSTKRELDLVTEFVRHAKNLYITGSGTSYNAALVAKHLFSKYAKIKIEPLISSEVQFSSNLFDHQSILIAVSQSGESADVLEAVNIAKKEGAKIISIVNITTSSLVHASSISIGLNCGPEIGVAATKSFTSQLAILYKITERLGGFSVLDLDIVSKHITTILSDHSKIQNVAKKLKDVSDIYVLGRGVHYPIASEAALKLKELTYVHAEGIPGGELKHGPLALMDSNVYVIIINPNDSTYVDTLASAHEIKARGAKIIGISDKPSEVYDYWIEIPSVSEILFPLIEIIPIQLLAYYSALEKETDPDYPRNLAKSVTVK
ncbi:MAG: glutamine--fructose-6-phosphate transaminase (isomerizing) [Nitrosopumilaceae archaeon]